MATITITVEAGAAGAATKTFTLTAPNVGRIVAWAKAFGTPVAPGDPPLTNAQALERWIQWVMEMTKAHLVEDERRKQAIPDFVVTG